MRCNLAGLGSRLLWLTRSNDYATLPHRSDACGTTKKGIQMQNAIDNRHPGDAEAAAAIAAMQETYPSGYRPSPGDVVIGEPPFVGYPRAGIVRATNGESCLVEMDGEMLMYYPRELEFTGKRIGG